MLIYALFAHGQADPDNFGATHPAVQARAVMGRAFVDILANLRGAAPVAPRAAAHHPSNGG